MSDIPEVNVKIYPDELVVCAKHDRELARVDRRTGHVTHVDGTRSEVYLALRTLRDALGEDLDTWLAAREAELREHVGTTEPAPTLRLGGDVGDYRFIVTAEQHPTVTLIDWSATRLRINDTRGEELASVDLVTGYVHVRGDVVANAHEAAQAFWDALASTCPIGDLRRRVAKLERLCRRHGIPTFEARNAGPG